MRHQKVSRRFRRTSAHRQAMFKNLAISLIDKEVIKTTLIRAKELRRFIEPFITLAKVDNLKNRRLVLSRLNNKKAVGKLFTQLGSKSILRNGGYTRVLRYGFRKGDNSILALIELVDRDKKFD